MCGPKACVKWTKRRIINCWKGCKIPTCIWKGCCLCPHGCCYTIMGVMGAFGALWMNMYVIMSCKFQRITEINAVTGEPIESTRRGYGMIGREIDYYNGETEDYQGCVYYPEEEREFLFDFWRKQSRNLAFAGGVLGTACFVLLIFAYCFKFTAWTFDRWAMWAYIYAALCIAFTNLMYGSEFCRTNECKVANGTGYAISCFCFYLMMANQVKSMARPERSPKTMPRPGGPEDNYWYDDPNNQFPDISDSEDEDDEDDFDAFDDEYFEGEEDRFQNEPRLALPGPDDGLRKTEAFDENKPYMADEAAYAVPQDPEFQQRDQDIYRQQQKNEPPPMMALPASTTTAPPAPAGASHLPMGGGPVPPRPSMRNLNYNPQQQQQQQSQRGFGGRAGPPPGQSGFLGRGGRAGPQPGRSFIGPGAGRGGPPQGASFIGPGAGRGGPPQGASFIGPGAGRGGPPQGASFIGPGAGRGGPQQGTSFAGRGGRGGPSPGRSYVGPGARGRGPPPPGRGGTSMRGMNPNNNNTTGGGGGGRGTFA